MHPYHLNQLGAFCRDHPLRTKVLFVPSAPIGYNLTTALTASGQVWLNLHITTPAGWAEQQIGPQLRVAGWKALVQDTELFYLESILERVVQGDPENYFAGLSISPSLTRSFLRTLQSLRFAGVEKSTLQEVQIEPKKIRLLAALYQEYSGHLEKEQCFDAGFLFARAIEYMHGNSAKKDEAIYAILDETPLPSLAFQYLKALAGDRIYRIGRKDYGIAPPSHSAAARFPDAPFPGKTASIGVGGKLLMAEGLCPADGETIRLKKALGAESEVRDVFREVLHNKISLDTVEIAYTTESPYLGLLHNAAERFAVPVAFFGGIPVALTQPGQALLGFYRWIGSGFDAEELVRLGRAGLLTFNEVMEAGETLEPYQAAMLLEQGHIGQGRANYEVGFERLRQGFQQRLEELQEEDRATHQLKADQDHLLTVRRVVNLLLSLVPQANVAIEQITEAGIKFLRLFAPVRNNHDASAQNSLVARLQELGANLALEGPPARFAQRLGELIEQHKIETSVAKPGHLYAVPLERAGYNNRTHLYVLGMDEGSFPGGASEDPILLDDERSQLSGELTLQRTKPGEQVWHLIRVLGQSMGRVTLLASCRSLVDGRETYPSALFQQAAEQLVEGGGDEVLTLALVPDLEAAIDDIEAMLAARKAAGFREAVSGLFSWLVDGEKAVQARELPQLTQFDGWLGKDTPELDIAHGDTVLSASKLETLTACPYRYFLRYVLHVEPPDESITDPTRWLTPLEFGSLLHDLFYQFMKTLQERGESPDQARHTDLLAQMLQQAIDQKRERLPVLHEAAYRADCARLEQAAKIFLAVEAGREGVEPVGFEVSFGFDRDDGLNRAEAVPLRLSERVQLSLRGRIDRIDRVGREYEIWDYKTGSMRPYDEEDLLKRGAHLQWALYAQALDYILSAQNQTERVRRSGYFFTSERENGRRISAEPPAPHILADLLEPLFDLVAQGCFFHLQKEDQCTYCDYRRLCAAEQCLPKHMKDIREAMGDRPKIWDSVERWMSG
jgi:RecB family exonuclease